MERIAQGKTKTRRSKIAGLAVARLADQLCRSKDGPVTAFPRRASIAAHAYGLCAIHIADGIVRHNRSWFHQPAYSQLIEADGFGGDGVEFAAAVIKGLSPRDQLEAMLGAQMAVMHWASMKCMRQVADRRGTQFEESAVAMATKLARTFAAEMEVLKRYRSGGEQKVTVQHVQVEKRGQDIVGTVTHTKSRKPALAEPADATPLLSDLRGSAKPVPGDLAYEEQAWREYVARQKTSP
jgi:hypothetical protein